MSGSCVASDTMVGAAFVAGDTLVDVVVVVVVNDCGIDDQVDRLADVLPLTQWVGVSSCCRC